MKRLVLAIVALMLLAAGSRAQSGFTQAHAIVLDPTGVPYANCSGSASFVPSPSATTFPTIGGSTFPTTAVIASCDSFGAFSLKLADNNVVVDGHTSPPASQWRFNINAQGGTPGFTCTMTITGPAQDVSASLQACAAPLPSTGGSNVFDFVTTTQSATPAFIGKNNTAFSFVLNQNVTSSTFNVTPPANKSPVWYVNPCQDAVGGRFMTWPSNVTLPANYVFSPTALACSPVAFVYNPNTTQWTPWMNVNATGGGGGGGPALKTNGSSNTTQNTLNLLNGTAISLTADAVGGVTINSTNGSTGAQGTVQCSQTSGTFQTCNQTDLNGVFTNTDTNSNRGPNPGVDITAPPFNGRVVSTSAIPLTTATITGGTNSLTVASNSGWQKNDGFALQSGGITNCQTPPVAPTGFAGLASAMTGTGHAVAGATGSTSYSYVVIAISKGTASTPGGCYTAASPILTISNGNAALGATNIPITSCANLAGTVTCTVGSTTGLGSGMWVRIGGTNDDTEFGGRHNITVLNGTQFTYASNMSSIYPMQSTTATGGTLYYWIENAITLPALPAGTNMYKEVLYRCTGASCALPANAANYSRIYVSYPLTLGYTDASYGVVDDYGSISTVTAGTSVPWFVPATPPATNVNDMLVTTITNIAGTNFTLATNAGNTVGATSCNGGSCSLRLDNVPAINAAQAASNTVSPGGGGSVHIPPPLSASLFGTTCYITSSYLTVSSIVNVGGGFCPGETIELNGNRAALNGTQEDTIHSIIPTFGTQALVNMVCLGANPCIWARGPSIKNVYVTSTGSSETLVFDTSNTPTLVENSNFNVLDAMGIDFYVYGQGFGGLWNNTGYTAGPLQVIGAIDTPSFIIKNNGQINFDFVTGSLRGIYYEWSVASGNAFNISIKMGEEWQGPITPILTVNAIVGSYGDIYMEHIQQDSGAEPIFANASTNSFSASVVINGVNPAGKDPAAPIGGNQPIISGNPINGGVSILTTNPVTAQLAGMNHDLITCMGQPASNLPNYTGCGLPALNLATATYGVNHTLTGREGIVKASASGITFTLPHALTNQTWQILNPTAGTITLAIDSGTLSGNGATGSITIAANSGGVASCDGTNCSAFGFGGGGGGGGSPGGSTNALQSNGGGSSFAGTNSPTTNGNYVVNYNVIANASVPPTINLPGYPVNAQSGTTYTIGAANTQNDRFTLIRATNSAAQTYTAVNPSVAGFGFNMGYTLWNTGSASGLLTENSSGFNINGGTSIKVPINWIAPHYSNGVDYFAAILPTLQAFPACLDSGGNHYNNDANGNLVCGTSASGNGLSGMTAGQVPIAATATSVTSSEALAGAGAAITTGPASSTSGDVTQFTGTGGQVSDSGFLASNVVRKDATAVLGAFLYNFSASTLTLPSAAGATASATNTCTLDTTNKNIHCFINSADAIVPGFVSAPTTGDCIKATVSGGNVLLADGGGLICGIQNTTTTNPTTLLTANTCGSATTVAMTGVTSTMIPLFGAASDITGSVGWGSTGGIVIVAWFTSNTLNYKLCNQTTSSITPGAVAWNVGAH